MYMDGGQERVRRSYRDNYERLARVEGALRPRQRLPHQPEHSAELTLARLSGPGAPDSHRRARRSAGEAQVALSEAAVER